jgi:RNA 3'-terminal phosphate cyclase
MMMRSLILAVGAVAGVANAAVHEIDVGMGGSLAFSPNSITAAVGDS